MISPFMKEKKTPMSGVTYIHDVVVTCHVWEHEVEMERNSNQELRFLMVLKEMLFQIRHLEKKGFDEIWSYVLDILLVGELFDPTDELLALGIN